MEKKVGYRFTASSLVSCVDIQRSELRRQRLFINLRA